MVSLQNSWEHIIDHEKIKIRLYGTLYLSFHFISALYSFHKHLCNNHIQIIKVNQFFNLPSDTSIYDGCNFCNCRVLLKFIFLKNIGYVATNTGFINTEKLCHSLLRTPNGFVFDNDLHLPLFIWQAVFGKDYFRELLERVRSIRASERRIWQQITDIYAECSVDYDKNSPTTRDFYAMIQNRFHYAITGQTAAEIIYTKADHRKEHMGLTTWKNAPDGRILKSDVSIAKNYLQEKEIRQLERAVTGFFDYIEDLIERENTFNMSQFSESVNEFLTFRRYQILPDKGRISASQAKAKAESEYDIFNKTQRIDSDFDKQVRGILDK